MKLSKAHFYKDTEKNFQSTYSFFADESIQISELTDHVIKISKSKGFEEKQTHIITKDSDWAFLVQKMRILIYLDQKKL